MESKLFSYLDATRGRVKEANIPYYHTFFHSVMPFVLEKGVNVRFEFINSWYKWPETVKIGSRWNVIYDQYFGQCLSRINRNIMILKSKQEAVSFSLRLISQQAMKLGYYDTAIEAAVISRYFRQNTKFTVNDEQNVRHIITLTQEAFVFFHEFYHFFLSFDNDLKEDIRSSVKVRLLDKSMLISSYIDVPESARQHLQSIRQRSGDLAKNDKFLDELCCDYLAASLIITTYGSLVRSLGLVAQAIDMLFYYIRYMSTCAPITSSIVNERPIEHTEILAKTIDIQIRHQIIRNSIVDIAAGKAGAISKSKYELWQSTESIRAIYDKNTDVCVDYTLSPILGIHRNSINSNKTLLQCFDLDKEIDLIEFRREKVADQYELLDALFHGNYS